MTLFRIPLLRLGLIVVFIGSVGTFSTGCMAETRAGVGGDGGMRGGRYTSARGQYSQRPTESKAYLKDVLHN